MNYLDHMKRWADCQACTLCKDRRRVILYRGNLPCEVLLVGEGPGLSEDVLGRPFVGPSGKLLDDQVAAAMARVARPVTLGFTNVVACIPLPPTSRTTVRQPTPAEVEACRPRLAELVRMARPRVVVAVGGTAKAVLEDPKVVKALGLQGVPIRQVVHPAYILTRVHHVNQGLVSQGVVDKLAEAFGEVVNAVGP